MRPPRGLRLHPARLPLACAVLLPLLAAGCGGERPPPPRVFSPPNYAYLTKIQLNVGAIEVEDHSVPGGTDAAGAVDVSAQSPTPPSVALTEMAHDRLFADGTSGKAVFVIDQANIMRDPNGTLNGVMAVHLDLLTARGTRGGYAEARVAKQYVPGSEPADFRGTLYDLTNQMMSDMNVEFEFQIRRSLKDWLVSTANVPAPVAAQPLSPPAPETPALPSFIPPPQPASPPPPRMSPPPGFLQAPPSQ